MEKKNMLSELTMEELQARAKKQKQIAIVLVTFMALTVGALVYLAIKSKNYALMAVGGGSFITMLPVLTQLSQTTAEIKRREAQQSY